MRIADGVRRLWRARFLRFCVVGGGATMIHAGIFLVACAGLPTFWANALGYVTSLVFNVTANFAWTFGEPLLARSTAGKALRFFLITLVGFALNSVISVGMVDGLGARPVWAALLMVTVTPVTVYTLNVRLVFTASPSAPTPAPPPRPSESRRSSGRASASRGRS